MSKSVALLLVLAFVTASCIAVKPAMSSVDATENTWASKAPMQQARQKELPSYEVDKETQASSNY